VSGSTATVEPTTLEDGYAVFHEDGSTSLNITVPPGRGGTGEPQYDRLHTRLLELALLFGRDE
jgi:hypothetical protein